MFCSLIDGNDTIFGFSDTSSIQVTQGKLDTLIHSDGFDLVLGLGENSVTLSGAADLKEVTVLDFLGNPIKTVIERDLIGTEGADTFRNIAEGVSVISGAGNDTISNTGDHTTISGGAGNDSIIGEIHWTVNGSEWSRYSANSVSIDGGEGDDTIRNQEGSFSTISGGAGDDFIENRNLTSDVTINGGAGDDHIFNYGKKVLFEYSSGDGNDYISGFNATSTLQIGGGTGTYSFAKSSEDFVFTVGDGKDVIFGFDNKDTLTLDRLDFSPSYKNGVITLKTDGGSVTLKDFSATTFHVNNDIYQINGKNKFVKQ